MPYDREMPYWSARARRALALAATLLHSARASGQEATALDRFDPAPASDAFFTVPSADVRGDLRPGAAALLTYADRPLQIRAAPASGEGGAALGWVSRQLVLHALADVQIARRFSVDLDVPFTLDQGGTSGVIADRAVQAPSGAAVGDLRLGARAVLVRGDGLLPGAALRLSLWLPSGDDGAFSGAPSARFAPALLVGRDVGRWSWSATLGGRFQSTSEESLGGSETFAGAATAIRLGGLQVGPELTLRAGADSPPGDLVRSGLSAEALLGARYALGPVILGAGGGPGLGLAPGTPTYRLFASLGVAAELGAPRPRPAEGADRAGQGARKPAAADSAASAAAGRPAPAVATLPDRDGDTVPDAADICPALVGAASPPRPGCPPDADQDGIHDADDRCPAEPGFATADAARHGCPADTDGDGIVDAKDACPYERGETTADPATSGCPRAVRLEGMQIVILQQVNFATGKAEILPDSHDLLRQVAAVLEEHPEIARVAVDGHTDNRGAEQANLSLSQSRALAVVRWLTEHGVDARRLEARGFGPRRPLVDNATEAGRAKNRRVEFQIRKRTPEGAAGWRDGPLDE